MYPSDLSDHQWALIEPFTKRPDPRGAASKYEKREIINAILYVNKTGCQWRQLPANFPPWPNVYDHYQRMQQRGVWMQMMHELNRRTRQKGGGRKHPVAC